MFSEVCTHKKSQELILSDCVIYISEIYIVAIFVPFMVYTY
jgi:hypothetical protein